MNILTAETVRNANLASRNRAKESQPSKLTPTDAFIASEPVPVDSTLAWKKAGKAASRGVAFVLPATAGGALSNITGQPAWAFAGAAASVAVGFLTGTEEKAKLGRFAELASSAMTAAALTQENMLWGVATLSGMGAVAGGMAYFAESKRNTRNE